MVIDKHVLEFGKVHNKAVVVLEAMAGGNGPYGQSIKLLDSATTRDAFPKEYVSREVVQVRELATKLEQAGEEDAPGIKEALEVARDSVLKKHDPFTLLAKARAIAMNIEDDVQRLSRIHQINSLENVAHLLVGELYAFSEAPEHQAPNPTYHASLRAVTGFDSMEMKTRSELDLLREDVKDILTALDYTEGTFAERVAAMRLQHAFVPEEEYAGRFESIGHGLVDHIKELDLSFPEQARMVFKRPDIVTPGVQGECWYGRDGDFTGQAFVVPKESNSAELLNIVTHEIGGHFRLSVLWDQYTRETGDHYGRLHTISSNMGVIQEGIAEHGLLFYPNFVKGYVADPKVLEAEFALYRLNRALLGYQIARHFSKGPVDEQVVIDECTKYGMLETSAKTRAGALQHTGGHRLFFQNHVGPCYDVGLHVVQGNLRGHSQDKVWQAVRQPISIAIMHRALHDL